ncbi:T9SS type A sorting domain-containing protein [Tenacibaculum sp. nBUS_03]|uniref:T9SS type A sorting domain-containing protein n=1 Tax=Tenacibaculum sp. nBUS_03 TaxID=3395320 RepID=UPI003EB932D7
MKTQLFFLTLLLCININAQIDFQEHIVIDESISANNPKSIVSIDIDGDGDKDIVSASYDDYTVGWYENLDGNGNFGVRKKIFISNSRKRISSIHVADINNDGYVDVLFSSNNANIIAWYKNKDGLGNFEFGGQIASGINLKGVNSIFSQDIDGDGDLDVLSSSFIADKVAWFENLDGLGNFGSQNIISTLSRPRSVLSEDMDGDGSMDVVIISNYITEWCKNLNGLGDFGPQNIISTKNVSEIYIEDFDNDNDMDIVSASSVDNKIVWFENTNGLGNFGTEKIISTTAKNVQSIFSIDIDNDGDNDIISAFRDDNKIVWFENTDGMGSFGTEEVVSTNAIGAKLIFASDIDDDGDNDIISASIYDDKIVWYKNINGLGEFEEQNRITQSVFKPESVFVADLDGDGDNDIISASWADDKIAWYENINGLGEFGNQKIISTKADYVLSVFSTDIDGDGDMDILSASYKDNKIAWYENIDGKGNFGDQQIISSTEESANYVYAVDLDQDGDMDVITSSYNGIAWFMNQDGFGQFSSRQKISSNNFQRYAPYAADFDGDGDLDIASTSRYSGGNNELAWYENTDGQQTFTHRVITTDIDAANSTFATDIDQDGDMDILAAAYNKIALYKNNTGLGDFSSEKLLTVDYLNGANSINYKDIDLDGFNDLIYGISEDDAIVWKKNINGLGVFGNTQVIGTNSIDVKSVFVADIDGDGDMDVVASSIGDNKVSWYENSTNTLGTISNDFISFSIYPNPTENVLNIVSKTKVLGLEIYNNLGQLVFAIANKNVVNISKLKSGIYFIKIKDAIQNVEIKKVVKR